jgi:hypothetical protein
VPTGPGYDRLTSHVKTVIEEAVATVGRVARQHGYRRVIYSAANPQGDLGTGIFQVGEDVKRYIVEQLRGLR